MNFVSLITQECLLFEVALGLCYLIMFGVESDNVQSLKLLLLQNERDDVFSFENMYFVEPVGLQHFVAGMNFLLQVNLHAASRVQLWLLL